MIFMRKLHKWLGLVIGLQFLVWILSGFVISLVDHHDASGMVTRHGSHETRSLSEAGSLVPLSGLDIPETVVESIALEDFITGPVYRVVSQSGVRLFDATSGRGLSIDQELAGRIAAASYHGDGQPVATEYLVDGSDEVRGVDGPLWRVEFADELGTRVYLSGQDGRVLAHRNSSSQLVDFLLMLHFMDYFRAGDFNHPLIIVTGFGALWIALSGVLLVFSSFSRADFARVPGLGSGSVTARARVRSEEGARREFTLPGSLHYYAGLAGQGVNLPSNCEGSGSCGLCRVRYEEDPPPPTAIDREWIDSAALAGGARLACQHKPRTGDAIVVPEVAFSSQPQLARVVSSRWLTPFLKEICLRPQSPVDYQPGELLEFLVPAFTTSQDKMNVAPEFLNDWNALDLPKEWSFDHPGTLRRSYSLANAPGATRDLSFMVRFSAPPAGSGANPGVGSSYMCSLQAGDPVEFRGPVGEFRLASGDREKIFIGGGAGLAPLKSMVEHLLSNQAWPGVLRLWYGARSRQEILYGNHFQALADAHQNFHWQVALSEAQDDLAWEGHTGLIHEVVHRELLAGHPNLGDCEFYLCGPPQMLEATRKMLAELGVADDAVRFDDFGN